MQTLFYKMYKIHPKIEVNNFGVDIIFFSIFFMNPFCNNDATSFVNTHCFNFVIVSTLIFTQGNVNR
jgi:hypothetical protein